LEQKYYKLTKPWLRQKRDMETGEMGKEKNADILKGELRELQFYFRKIPLHQ